MIILLLNYFLFHFQGFWYSEPFLSWINTSHSQEDLDQWSKQFLAPVLKLKPGLQSSIIFKFSIYLKEYYLSEIQPEKSKKLRE